MQRGVCGQIAQLVEHWPEEPSVLGSIPSLSIPRAVKRRVLRKCIVLMMPLQGGRKMSCVFFMIGKLTKSPVELITQRGFFIG